MRYKTRLSPTAYLMLKGNLWYFTKSRGKHKPRLVIGLKTSDLKEAQKKRAVILGHMAGQELSHEQEALQAAQWHRDVDEEGKIGAEYGADEWVEGLHERGEIDGDERRRLYKIATNQITPVTAYFDAWMRERRVEEGATIVRKSAFKVIPFKYLHEATPQSVGKYVSDLVEGSGLTVNTMQQRLIQYRSYWRFLHSKGVVDSNPWLGHTIRKDRRYKTREGSQAWTFVECRRMLQDVSDREVNFTLYLMMYSGCRVSEVSRLLVRDVRKDHFEVTKSKTISGERNVYLPKHVMNGLTFRCSDQEPDAFVLFRDVSPRSEFKRTQAVTARISTVLRRLFPEHQVKGRRNAVKTLHGLRKLLTQTAEHEGVMPHVLSAMMGWSRGHVGLDVYSKPSEKMVKEGFAKVHAKFDAELI